jgi:hypothetical protein
MAEGVPIERWKLYLHRFLLCFTIAPVMAAAFELPRRTVVRVFTEGMLFALTISVVSWWMERRRG